MFFFVSLREKETPSFFHPFYDALPPHCCASKAHKRQGQENKTDLLVGAVGVPSNLVNVTITHKSYFQ